MNPRILKVAALALCVSAVSDAGAAPALPEFRAVYQAEWKGLTLGDIVIRLQREHGECYRYESEAKPVALVRMFYGEPREISRFCVVDDQVRPQQFVYNAGKDSFRLDFNWSAHKVFGGVGERELPDGAQDRLGMHQAVRLWVLGHDGLPDTPFHFTMVQEDDMDPYVLTARGTQAVKVPDGEFEALLVERTDRDDRIGRFWLAEERDYMPVKVETGKDEVQLQMRLKSFERLEPAPEPPAAVESEDLESVEFDADVADAPTPSAAANPSGPIGDAAE